MLISRIWSKFCIYITNISHSKRACYKVDSYTMDEISIYLSKTNTKQRETKNKYKFGNICNKFHKSINFGIGNHFYRYVAYTL